MSYFLAWVALMGLLAATAASAFLPLGGWNSALNLAIACAKALLVALVYMELRRSGGLLRLAALMALLTLALLFGLSWTDYATRHPSPAPWALRLANAAEGDSVVPSTIGMAVRAVPAGVEVTGLRKDGAAARAGLKVGDVVVRYDGHSIAGLTEFRRLVLDTKPGSVVRLVFLRAGAVHAADVTVKQLDVSPRA
jgi:cytochrome c oxidase subunit IV